MNRLAAETSPYLLQHADNPVEWYPWGDEALAKAMAEDKPIFLSIGYSACHWCHVMAHESFENAEIAAVMNRYFVNVKVDREERPDLDSIYMDAVVALTGQGGWPMSVFLTPEGVPFYGGTYFPPNRRGGMPAFGDVLTGIHDAWANRRDTVLNGGAEVRQHIAAQVTAGRREAGPLQPDIVEQAVRNLFSQFDWRHAGWGGAPKFPQPMVIEALLRHHLASGDPLALEMATKTLDAMQRGGMYDQLGGGFHRYSTDAQWLVPHFEKMLYDNSQLARVYLHAWQVTHDPAYRRCVEEILDYVLAEMTDPQGGFYSTQDADSDGEEGKYFVWSEAEVNTVLGDSAAIFKARYGVTGPGNFEGKNILFVANSETAIARQFGLAEADVHTSLTQSRRRMLDERGKRVKPHLDDKVVTAWNGLMMAAFAEAGRVLERSDYAQAALRNAEFLVGAMRRPDGRLYRTWRQGQAKIEAYLEDYASLAEGLLCLYEVTWDANWFETARTLCDHILEHFSDDTGLYDTSTWHESLLFRPRTIQDNAVPSGGSLAATVLLKIASYTGAASYFEAAERLLIGVQAVLIRYPSGFGQWLSATSYALSGAREIAISADPADARLRPFLDTLREKYRPFQVCAVGLTDSIVPLLAGRGQTGGLPTAFICRNFVCRMPVTSADAFRAELEEQPAAGSAGKQA